MRSIIFSMLLLFCGNVYAQETVPFDTLRAVVKRIHDGDSYGVSFLTRPDTIIYIRLHNADAPEIIYYVTQDQPYGRQATKNLKSFMLNDTVTVAYQYTDNLRRWVCDVNLDGIDLTEFTIQSGNAWYMEDKGISKERENKLKSLQKDAKKHSRGLWGEKGRKLRPDTWRERYGRNAR